MFDVILGNLLALSYEARHTELKCVTTYLPMLKLFPGISEGAHMRTLPVTRNPLFQSHEDSSGDEESSDSVT